MSAPAAGGGDQDGELAAWASGHAATVGRPAPARQAGAEIAAAEELEPRLLSVLQGKGNRPEGGATRSGEDRQGVRGLALARVDDGGFLLATGSHDGTVKVFDPITGALLQTITDHTDTVRGVALHALRDGSVLLATCSEDGTVRVWDPVEARCLQVLEDTGGCSDAAAFIELDGELLLVTGDRDGARIRDPHTGETLRMLEGHRQKVYCLAVTVLPDGTALLATGSNDSNVRVWDLRTGACVHVLEGYSAEIHTVRFGTLPDGTTFVFCDGMGSRLIAWDVGTGAQLYSTVHDAGVVEASSFLLQPDGSIVLLLTDSSARGVRLWDPVRGQPVRQLLTVDDPPWSMLLFTAPDGRLFMAAGTSTGDVSVWTLTGERALADGPRGLTLGAEQARLGAAGPRGPARLLRRAGAPPLVAVADEGVIRVWDIALQETVHTLQEGGALVWHLSSAALDGGTERVIASEQGGTVRIWDPEAGTCVERIETSSAIAAAATTMPDGRSIIAVGGVRSTHGVRPDVQQSVGLAWLPAEEEYPPQVTEQPEVGYSLAFTRLGDGTTILSMGGGDGSLTLCDIATGDCRTRIMSQGSVRSVVSCDLSDGTAIVVAGTESGTIMVVDAGTGVRLHEIDTSVAGAARRGVESLSAVALPDGGGLIAAVVRSAEGPEVGIWDVVTGEQLLLLPGASSGNWVSTETIGLLADDTGLIWIVYPHGQDYVVSTLDVALGGPAGFRHRDRRPFAAVQAAVDGLPWLANAGIHAPLSLLADLVVLTGGREPADQLAALAEHPGADRLRSLRWPPPARVGLAALLLENANFDAGFVAPQAPVPDLRRALLAAMRRTPNAAAPVVPPMGALMAGADEVTEQVLALLALLGPDAVAADPLLPLRVRHEAACLPLLDPRVRTAITEIPRQVKTQIESHAASSRASAGTVGLRRRGTPRSLLRTQLALPSELRNLLEVRGNLLYRLHDGEPELHLEPMVLVLDTSPPTFGPVESTLRLVAHGLAGGLLGRQREAAVVTLDRPARVVPLRRHSDLMALWTSRMLDPPQLRTALLTAESVGFAATAVLTTHHVAREYPLPGRANLRVVTAHAPGEKPPLATTNPYTVHLGPRAQATEIARAVVTILVGADGR